MRTTLLFLCVVAYASSAALDSALVNEVDDEVKFYCGNCCGYDIYCNTLKNPFILQDKGGLTGGALVKRSEPDPSLKYYCFSCCGYDWYCN